MVVMATALFMALALVVLGSGTGGFFRRRLSDQRTSVKDYQQALDTLRHMSARRAETEGAPPRPAAARNRNGLPPVARSAAGRAGTSSRRSSPRPTASGRGTQRIASSAGSRSAPARRDRAAAFRSRDTAVSMRVDTAEVAEAPASAVGEEAPPDVASSDVASQPGTDTATVEAAPARSAAETVHKLAAARDLVGTNPPRRSMPSRRKTVRPGRTTVLTAAAILVIVAVTAAAIALGPSHHTPVAGTPVARSPATTQVVRHAATRVPKPKTSTSHTSATGALTPVTSSSSSATYQLTSPSFTLALVADGACWVEATNPSTGQVLWTGTMQAGQAQQIPGSGQLLLRLGDAHNVTLTVGGRQVALPPGFTSVVDLTFQAA